MIKEKKRFEPITLEKVCTIYDNLYSGGFISFQRISAHNSKISAILYSINNTHFETYIYTTISEKVTAYLYFFIKDHPFTDGNKRTAVMVFDMACVINNLDIKYEWFTQDQMAIFIEGIKTNDHQLMIKNLSRLLFDL